ncbi:MAG: PQQ-binding-like beta-propeller repeat protein [Planctomycetes bacterium]|nr:PQQ-binding-like beta-propeller repeat protein [Planctomycetota bacterium]
MRQIATRASILRERTTIAVVLAMATTLGGAATASASDWFGWRGPEQAGFAREKAVVTQWEIDGENQLWKSDIGGRSTPILMNGRLYAIAPAGEDKCVGEQVVCLDADTGKTIWAHRFNVYLSDIVENRIAWSSVVADPETGNIYAYGTGGEFMCLSGKDGTLIWKEALGENFGRFSGYGGRVHTPIIDEDKAIISIEYLLAGWDTGPNKAGHRFLAFDKKTGELIWSSLPGEKPLDTTYATPVVTVINGVRMMITPCADGNVYGIKVRTGERIWQYRLAKRGLNTSPVVDGKFVYVTQSEENLNITDMGAIVCLDGSLTGDITDKGEIWRINGITAGYASPALANGRLYVVDNSAEMHCFDAKTGKKFWEYRVGRAMKGSPVVTTDGVIYIGEVNGIFKILKDAGDKCVELDTKHFEREDRAVVEINGAPIVSDGRVYFMTRYGTYCLGKKGDTTKAEPAPSMAAEAPAQKDKPASLLVVPAEVTVAPGERVAFQTRVFDSNGVQIDGKPVTWAVERVSGNVDKSGNFTAATDNVFSSGVVTAQLGGIKASGRIRISPRLPIHESFDKMKAGGLPAGWIGLDVKSALADVDGNIVLQKLAKSPSAPYMRLEAFSGPPIPAGYTVQADMLAKAKRGRRVTLPDMGLINARYQLVFQGQLHELEIGRWKDEPIHSLKKQVHYEMTPGIWYTMKMRSDLSGGKATIRGKVWPRDEKEPDAWTIELEDDCPNTEGAPGINGFSNGTTVKKEGAGILFDNYQVFINE